MPDQVELNCAGTWVLHDLPLAPAVQAQVDRQQVTQRPAVGTTETTPAPDSAAGAELGAGVYDPGEHTVAEVLAYLAALPSTADGATERDRVKVAEAAGKARSTILTA